MIQRSEHARRVRALLSQFPVVALLGARQVGKTTLARQVAATAQRAAVRFDLEAPGDLALLRDPMLALEGLRGLVIIDEIHHRPELFPMLRVLADRRPRRAHFLVLGSASPDLLRQSSESLAGRIAHYELGGFALDEVGLPHRDRLWLRGGFPRAYLAGSNEKSVLWRNEFMRTFVERDLPQLGFRIGSKNIERFWAMLAHYHGQLWSASEFGRAFGVADHTVRRYLDLLTQTFMVRQLRPWHENLAKRQVKAPKIYLSDSGLLHALIGATSMHDLERHPRVGASWEGFVLHEVIRLLGARPEDCYFWRTHAGAELDLLVIRSGRRRGFEFKRTEAPSLSPSMRSAMVDLKLGRLDVIHAGKHTFPLADHVRAVAIGDLERELA